MLTRIDELKERVLKLQRMEKDETCGDVDYLHEYKLIVKGFVDFFSNVPRQHFRGELALCLIHSVDMKKASRDLHWLQDNFTVASLRDVMRQEEARKGIVGIIEEATLDLFRSVGQGSSEAAKLFLDAILENRDNFDEIQMRAFKRRLFSAINRKKQKEKYKKNGIRNQSSVAR